MAWREQMVQAATGHSTPCVQKAQDNRLLGDCGRRRSSGYPGSDAALTCSCAMRDFVRGWPSQLWRRVKFFEGRGWVPSIKESIRYCKISRSIDSVTIQTQRLISVADECDARSSRFSCC